MHQTSPGDDLGGRPYATARDVSIPIASGKQRAMRTTPAQEVKELARETAMDLGHLVGLHVKIAYLELRSELLVMGRRARLIAALTALVALGYAFAIAGLAFVIGGNTGMGIPFVIIGLAHGVGGAVGMVFALRRPRRTHPMENTLAALNRGLAGATSPTAGPAMEKIDAR